MVAIFDSGDDDFIAVVDPFLEVEDADLRRRSVSSVIAGLSV